jgi:TPR repeat protein
MNKSVCEAPRAGPTRSKTTGPVFTTWLKRTHDRVAAVPSLSDEEKPALLDEQQRLKNLRVTWTAWLAAFGYIAAEVTTAPTLIGPLVGVSIVSRVVIERQLNANERALADPPRDDFQTRTKAHRRRYRAGFLGDSSLSRAADGSAIAALQVVSYREAAVRADERAQGAALAGRDDLEQSHMVEAMRLMERSRSCERLLAATLDVLGMAWADAIASEPQLRDREVPPSGGTVNVPPQAWEALQSTGLVTTDLEVDKIAMPPNLMVEVGAVPKSLLGLAVATAQSTHALALAAARVATRSEDLHVQLAVLAGSRRMMSEQYERALQAWDAGDQDNAVALMRSAAEAGSPDAMFELGALAEDQGDNQAAQRWLRMATEHNVPQVPQEHDLAYELDPVLSSVEQLWALPQLKPEAQRERVAPDDDVRRGVALRERGDLAGAEQAFRRADERGSPEGALSLGVLLRERGDLAGAEQAFRRADERDSPQGAANLGAMLLDRGDLSGAQEALRRAFKRLGATS